MRVFESKRVVRRVVRETDDSMQAKRAREERRAAAAKPDSCLSEFPIADARTPPRARAQVREPSTRRLHALVEKTPDTMGGRGGRGFKRKGGDDRVLKRDFKKGKRDNVWDPSKERGGRGGGNGAGAYASYDKTNEKFEEYYKAQKIVPDGEWDDFMASLRTPLPTSFRINGSGKYAEDIRDQIENKLFAKVPDVVDAGAAAECEPTEPEVKPPTAVRWYPDRLAWQFNYSRQQLRRLPHLESIHEFVKRANEYGSITRQEVVSMIPAFFLKIEPHHLVLDMCAAPGSKTFQLLEMLHGGLNDPQALPEGFVVANDVDIKRCNLLTHQTKRVNSPGLLVTNHEAQNFPEIKSMGGRTFPFDSILCDVPCSGDGTMRKAPDIWPRWTVGNGNGLHPLQLKIAMRAAHLLKIGGRLVYSTCTFNPIEDEAVVAAMLKQSDGALELVDMSGEMPNLRRVPGVKTWQAWDKHGKHDAEGRPEGPFKCHPTMFSDAESDALPLERCMRVLPHQDDTGGFFIAVFDKKREMPAAPEDPNKKLRGPITVRTELTVDTAEQRVSVTLTLWNSHDLRALREAEANGPLVPEKELLLTQARGGGRRGADSRGGGGGGRGGGRGGGGRGGGGYGGLDPILPVVDPGVIDSITTTYGIDREKLPLHKNAVTRTADNSRPKRVYMLSNGLREYLAADVRENLKVIAAGLKIFERQEHKDSAGDTCDYRLVQDGLTMTLPFLTRQIIRPTLAELKLILQKRSLQLAPDPERPDKPLFTDDATRAEVTSAVAGSCVFLPRLGTAEERAALGAGGVLAPEELAIACWKGKSSVNLLVSKVETDHMLEKFGVDVSAAGGGGSVQGGGMEVN